MESQGLGRGTFRGTPFHHDTPKAFPQIFILLASQARIRDLFQPMDSLGSQLDIIPGLDSEYMYYRGMHKE